MMRENALWISSVGCFLWHAGRWHTASSLHTTHSPLRSTWQHTQPLAVLVAQKTPTSVLIMTKKPWNSLRFKEFLDPRIAQASVLLPRTFFMSVSFSLCINHLPPIPAPSPLRYYLPFFSSCLFSILNNNQRSLAQSCTNHALLPSILACLSHRTFLLIIPSPSPSSVMLHQFAPTGNCVKNSSGCRVFLPGWDWRQLGRDGNGCQPGNHATGIHTASSE